jgi:hypothetical protein
MRWLRWRGCGGCGGCGIPEPGGAFQTVLGCVHPAETGISVGAVHRAKRQLEKAIALGKQQAVAVSLELPTSYVVEKAIALGKQQAVAVSLELPTSYVVKQDIGGVPQEVRRLTVSVYEQFVESAIGRGLLDRSNRDNPWAVMSALFAGMFDDRTIEWLNKRGYLTWGQHRQAEDHRRRQCANRTASLRALQVGPCA